MAKYIHVFVWACPLHTGGAYVVDSRKIDEDEEWEACACIDYSYIPVASFSVRGRRLLYEFTDVICDKLGITLEQWNKLVVDAVKEAQRDLATASNTGWEYENLLAELVRKVASGKIRVSDMNKIKIISTKEIPQEWAGLFQESVERSDNDE